MDFNYNKTTLVKISVDGSHSGWSQNFHYGKMPASKPGWLFMSTYTSTNDVWASNQLMIQLLPEPENPVIWRVSPTYNSYNGDYRDEVPQPLISVVIGYISHPTGENC